MSSIGATLAASPLARAGGLLVTRLADPATIDELATEARRLRPQATAVDVAIAPAGGEERGQPDRRLASVTGGAVLARWFLDPSALALLAHVTATVCEPLGNQGIYSYYRDDDFLGVHRDAASCDVAIITCIGDDGGAGGDLVVYPGRVGESMQSIRSRPDHGAVRIRLEPGQSAVLLGGLIAHRATAPGPGHERIVAPLCYRLAARSGPDAPGAPDRRQAATIAWVDGEGSMPRASARISANASY